MRRERWIASAGFPSGQNVAGIDVVAARIRERLAEKARDEGAGGDA